MLFFQTKMCREESILTQKGREGHISKFKESNFEISYNKTYSLLTCMFISGNCLIQFEILFVKS